MLILLLFLIILMISFKYGGKLKKKEVMKKSISENFINWIPNHSLIYSENKQFTDNLIFINKKNDKGFIFIDQIKKPCIVFADKRIESGSWQYMPESKTFIFPVPETFNYDIFIKDRTFFYETNRSYSLFERVKNPFNPPIIIEKYPLSFSSFFFAEGKKEEKEKDKGKKEEKEKVSVFRDDLLYGGTKQRALLNYALFMGAERYDSIIYAGPPQGVAQVALGVICKYLNKPAIMIYADPSSFSPTLRVGEGGFKKFPMSCKAAKMGVKLICGGALLDDVQEYARNYAKDNNGLLLPFGLDDPNFKGLLVEALRESIPQKIREERMVLWTIVGSGLLLNVFYEVFPNAFIMGVRAGKPIYFDSIDPSRTFTITTSYRFTQVPDILPPYPTVPCYDGKIWEQFLNLYPFFSPQCGEKGSLREEENNEKGENIEERILFENEDFKRKHYIWNVANEIL